MNDIEEMKCSLTDKVLTSSTLNTILKSTHIVLQDTIYQITLLTNLSELLLAIDMATCDDDLIDIKEHRVFTFSDKNNFPFFTLRDFLNAESSGDDIVVTYLTDAGKPIEYDFLFLYDQSST